MLDKAQEASDRKLARHLVALYYKHQDAAAQVALSACKPEPAVQAKILGERGSMYFGSADE